VQIVHLPFTASVSYSKGVPVLYVLQY
jgi:hypothetical protein